MSESFVPAEFKPLLQCPVCLEIFPDRVIQCKGGHSVCESHLTQMSACPMCRANYRNGKSRNLVAEEMIRKFRQQYEQRPADLSSTTRSVVHENATNNTLNNAASVSSLPTSSRSVIPPQTRPPISCRYGLDGCDFTQENNNFARSSLQEHENNCHFRPINCWLNVNGCNESVKFFDLISHLTGFHGVQYFQGSHHLHKYVVKNEYKKLVRDGPTSTFILEVAHRIFIVRAKEINDFIYVWVAFHGPPSIGSGFKVDIEYHYLYDDDNSNENHRPRLNLARSNIQYSPDDDDDEFEVFSGVIRATSRQTWEEVQATNLYLSMPVGHLRYNLKKDREPGRRYSVNSFAIKVTITQIL